MTKAKKLALLTAMRSLPDPAKHKVGIYNVCLFKTEKTPFLWKGKEPAMLTAYAPEIATFRRIVDELGRAYWCHELNLKPQNWRMN
jgi:hypothetical protein